MLEQPPWTLEPQLSEERLRAFAQLVADVRSDALAEHAPAKGDTNWGLGTRVYERTLHRLEALANSGDLPWLRVHRQGLYFVCAIGGVPVKFDRCEDGGASRPSARRDRRPPLAVECQQLHLPFDAAPQAVTGQWWLSFETHHAGPVLRVVVLLMDETNDRILNAWRLPIAGVPAEGAKVVPVTTAPVRKPAVEQPPAAVTPRLSHPPGAKAGNEPA